MSTTTGKTSSISCARRRTRACRCYEGDLDNLIGIVHMKRVAQELARDTLTRERLIELARAREPYFVPEGTSLTVQLNQFQRNRRRMAFVVDEYGDIQGFVTLEDILEEIVGEFTTDPATVTHKHVHREAPGRLHRQRQRHDPRAQSLARLAAAHRRPEDAERPAGRAARNAARSRRPRRPWASISSKCCRSARTPFARCGRAEDRRATARADATQPSAAFSASSMRVQLAHAQPLDGRARRVVLRDQAPS